jgi:WD40 repeat protein
MIDPIHEFRGRVATRKEFQPSQHACNRCVINRDGDLLFVASEKSVFGYNLMLERCFRVYGGHEGLVDDLDIDYGSHFLVSVGADYKIIVHEIDSEEPFAQYDASAFYCCCCFTASSIRQIAAVQSTQMRQLPILSVFHLQTQEKSLKQKFTVQFDVPINCVIWPADNTIICGDNQGKLYLIDVQNRRIERFVEAHRGPINSLTSSFDHTYIAAASNEQSASLWDLDLVHRATFPHPNGLLVSCCAISPIAPHIVLASSADKKDVATTNMGATDFTINFFHLIYQEEFASMKAHKSTVNWVGFTPDGMTIITTSHEGTFAVIRLGGEYADLVRNDNAELEKARRGLTA